MHVCENVFVVCMYVSVHVVAATRESVRNCRKSSLVVSHCATTVLADLSATLPSLGACENVCSDMALARISCVKVIGPAAAPVAPFDPGPIMHSRDAEHTARDAQRLCGSQAPCTPCQA